MRTCLDHLPDDKQAELARIVEILLQEMENINGNRSAKHKKLGRIDQIILFGSYSRKCWMDDKAAGRGVGYQSDYDILAVVNYEWVAMPGVWTPAEDRLIHAEDIRPPVGLIVHSRSDIHNQLHLGHYFFRDIRAEGILLFDAWQGTKPLPAPRALNDGEVYTQASRYFQENSAQADNFFDHFAIDMKNRKFKAAAFQLHQSTEFTYRTLMLTRTLYMPKGHNLKLMRSLAEQYDPALIEVWPRGRKPYDGYFMQLQRAYVEARYSPHYEITKEVAEWLGDRNAALRKAVHASCTACLAELREKAGRD